MEYLTKRQVKKNRNEFYNIYQMLKSKLGEEWSTSYTLVGSAKRNLVLVGNEGYDLDFHIYIHKSPIQDEKEIKGLFKEKLDEIINNYDLSFCEDSTHVLTTNKITNGQVEYSYDVAIMRKSKNGEYLILKNEKGNNGNGPYYFIQVPKAKGFVEKYKQIDDVIKWEKLRSKYKEKKEAQQGISKQDRKHSFSLLLESINEVIK